MQREKSTQAGCFPGRGRKIGGPKTGRGGYRTTGSSSLYAPNPQILISHDNELHGGMKAGVCLVLWCSYAGAFVPSARLFGDKQKAMAGVRRRRVGQSVQQAAAPSPPAVLEDSAGTGIGAWGTHCCVHV